MLKPDDLLPCPFCRDGVGIVEAIKSPPNKKNPQQSPIISYVIRHWCKKRPGITHAYIEIRGVTIEHATKQWNNRCQPIE